ncbi:transaldolase family protein, partial [Neisseria gonorrhoeae]|uniref:transaldolase family protein n=1 Tax=Neisseria gonorrhoeae TaxID=485 RepID=UPI00384E60E8
TGFVSLEVSPELAKDAQGTVEEARRLHAAIARKNAMIKVPATVAGCPYVGNRHGFVALFGAEVLPLEGGDLVGIKRVAGEGFLE